MKKYLTLFVMLCLFNTGFCQLPPMPGQIYGPDHGCRLTTIKFYIDPIPNVDSIVWGINFSGFITSLSYSPTDTVNISIFSPPSDTGSIIVYCHNSFGNGPARLYHLNFYNTPTDPGIINGKVFVCKGEDNVSYSVNSVMNADSIVWVVPSH